MGKFKKLTAFIMALCMTVGSAVFAVACGGGGDSSSKSGSVQGQVALTITAEKEDGTPLSGVSFTVTGRRFEETLTTGEDGKATCSVAGGTYTITTHTDTLPEYHLPDFSIKEVTLTEDTEIECVVVDNTRDGSEKKPFSYEANDDGEMTITLAASVTQYYEVRAMGRALFIENENVEVIYNGTTYSAKSGMIQVPLTAEGDDTFSWSKFAVVNKTAEEASVTMKLQSPLGASDNPIALELDEATTVTVTGSESVYYTWTAMANGTLTITSETGNISMHNTTNGAMESEQISVNEGDQVRVQVSVEGPVADGAVTEITFTASFMATQS